MKAIVREEYGPPENIKVKELPKPSLGRDDVLVEVKASSVSRTDCGILRGMPLIFRLFIGFRPKPVLGSDYAGIVVEKGENVTSFVVGDRVWGFFDEGLGSQAEFLKMNQDSYILKMPANIDFHEAVACTEGAHYAINFLNQIELQSNDRILINGATGGIGSALLQIIKSKGNEIVAVGNTKNVDLLYQLGADHVIDYEKEDFTKLPLGPFRAIFDAVGKSSFGACKHLLEPNGVYISSELGPRSENLWLPLTTKFFSKKRVLFPFPRDAKKSLLIMKEMIEKGQYTPVIDRTFPMEACVDAYRYVETGEKTGNVVLLF